MSKIMRELDGFIISGDGVPWVLDIIMIKAEIENAGGLYKCCIMEQVRDRMKKTQYGGFKEDEK